MECNFLPAVVGLCLKNELIPITASLLTPSRRHPVRVVSRNDTYKRNISINTCGEHLIFDHLLYQLLKNTPKHKAFKC
jgi:hypothetical protein